MAASSVTFGRLMEYLNDLGFDMSATQGEDRVGRLPGAGVVFLFRDRSPGDAVAEHELVLTRMQLYYRGLAESDEFDRALGLMARSVPVARPYS